MLNDEIKNKIVELRMKGNTWGTISRYISTNYGMDISPSNIYNMYVRELAYREKKEKDEQTAGEILQVYVRCGSKSLTAKECNITPYRVTKVIRENMDKLAEMERQLLIRLYNLSKNDIDIEKVMEFLSTDKYKLTLKDYFRLRDKAVIYNLWIDTQEETQDEQYREPNRTNERE